MSSKTKLPSEMSDVVPGVDPSLGSLDRVKVFLSFVRAAKYQGFDLDLISNHLKVLTATDKPKGRVTFSFTVPPTYGNRMGNLHGGAAALIFDVCTTAALAPIAKPGFWQYAGVTRALNVTYIRPAPVGQEVEVVAEVVHAGRRLATIKGEIRDKNGKVCCIAEHLKVSIDPVNGGEPPKVGGKL